MDEGRKRELWSCLALAHVQGLGPKTCRRLIDHYGSPYKAVAAAREWSQKRLVRKELAHALLDGSWRSGAENEWRAINADNSGILLWTDDDYPERLRQLPDPPLYLHVSGDKRLLTGPIVAMVGSRRCSQEGMDTARTMAAGLSAAGVTVASGFAQGIDRQAHRGAMQEVGRSIAVLGTGLDRIYPASNRDLWKRMQEEGLLLTEFPPKTKPEAHNFPRRNRIISGLSLGVVVVEAESKSGSLITAELAMEQNRDVFAVPGPVSSRHHDGCHALIRQGAMLVRSADDVLEELSPLLDAWAGGDRAGKGVIPIEDRSIDAGSLTEDEARLVALIAGEGRAHMDRLTRLLEWESSRVSSVLTVLEIQGVVRQLSGMYYALARR